MPSLYFFYQILPEFLIAVFEERTFAFAHQFPLYVCDVFVYIILQIDKYVYVLVRVLQRNRTNKGVCMVRGGGGKRKREICEGERLIDFKELAIMIWKLTSPDGQDGLAGCRPREEPTLQFKSAGHLGAESTLLPGNISLFLLRPSTK